MQKVSKKTPKIIEKVIFPDPQTPVQSKHTFSFSLSSGPRLPKRRQEASQNGAFGHPKSRKIKKKLHSKKQQKINAKSIKKNTKNACPFRAENSPKSLNPIPGAQNVPQASKRGSQAPKILKNHQKKSPRASKIT